MTRDDFDRILSEEGIDDAEFCDSLWRSKPAGGINEEELRIAAKKFQEQLPGIRLSQALKRAMDREFNRE